MKIMWVLELGYAHSNRRKKKQGSSCIHRNVSGYWKSKGLCKRQNWNPPKFEPLEESIWYLERILERPWFMFMGSSVVQKVPFWFDDTWRCYLVTGLTTRESVSSSTTWTRSWANVSGSTKTFTFHWQFCVSYWCAQWQEYIAMVRYRRAI